jgi:hypothetical protein
MMDFRRVFVYFKLPYLASMKYINLKLLLLLPAIGMSVLARAQKLPGTQKISLRAPVNIKIDGKPNEWKKGMQAYNRAIQASYTVANDDKRLYLVIRADKREIINKIINAGVTFSINKNNKKTTDNAVAITYPVFARDNRPVIGFNHLSEALADEKDEKKRDSVMLGCNATLEEKGKLIRVGGLADVDSLVSIYNLDGIKAKSGFDDKLVYTVEMSIDLKLLNIAATDLNQFNYNIKLNAVEIDYVPGIEVTRDAAGRYAGMSIDSKVAGQYSGVTSATDCWGEYKLTR